MIVDETKLKTLIKTEFRAENLKLQQFSVSHHKNYFSINLTFKSLKQQEICLAKIKLDIHVER